MKTIHDSLGIEVVEASTERVVATMPVDERTHQPLGLLHGGASVVLAESVASIGAHLNAGPGRTAVGVEINANHLRAKRSGVVRAVATPAHVGRSTSVWEIRIHDEDEKLICLARCTLAFVPLNS